ncbi:MAG TPA: O-methyltransferase [Pseudonocardia sp.]|jgi:catechol O-methyltransferase|nr:O-methyltransferase [Pseudonocardia sp.]
MLRNHRSLLASAALAVGAGAVANRVNMLAFLRRILWATAAGGAAVAVNEAAGKPVPFLRWSFLRLALGMRRLQREWQVGDGREQALADHVLATARAGDVDDAIRAVDEFCHTRKFMINIGDEKGEILDAAVRRARPRLVLELGTYCGYSALRIARAMPSARVCSVEFSSANAAVARSIWRHAGVADRVSVIVGTLGDGGATLGTLRDEHGLGPGALDLLFLDHDKKAYLPDLETIEAACWLRPGSVVVADNVGFPGVPGYRETMRTVDGGRWRTTEHRTHAEYQLLLPDLVLVSEYVG